MDTFNLLSFVLTLIFTLAVSSPVWNPEPLHVCPNIPPQKDLQLDHVAGDWRLAYLFLGQPDEGMDEDNTCVVTAIMPSHDLPNQLELSLFIDSARADHVDRSSAQFYAEIISPGEWRIHTPLTSSGFLHARVIRASEEHLVITLCSNADDRLIDDDEVKSNHLSKPDSIPDDWKALFADSGRKKRSQDLGEKQPEEMHVWTAVLVKHNDISALKFVEYAALLMKHGYDVTQGELVSFGKCPVSRPHTKDPL